MENQMENKKDIQLIKKRDKSIYKLITGNIKYISEALSAEYVFLNKTDSITPDSWRTQIEEKMYCRYSIPLQLMNSQFVKDGIFISKDIKAATEAMFAKYVDDWLYPEKGNVGGDEIVEFKNYFFKNYFSVLADITPTSEAKMLIPLSNQSKRSLHHQREVLKGIIATYINEGDNVLYYLCPLYPSLEYKITVENCTPFFLRLIERDGDNIFLRNADITSPDFIMAFAESLNFQKPVHKQEVLTKLATLLLNEGNRI